jgi:hypothetical protein
MLTKLYYIINLKKLLQVGILTFYRASVSSPFNRITWSTLARLTQGNVCIDAQAPNREVKRKSTRPLKPDIKSTNSAKNITRPAYLALKIGSWPCEHEPTVLGSDFTKAANHVSCFHLVSWANILLRLVFSSSVSEKVSVTRRAIDSALSID